MQGLNHTEGAVNRWWRAEVLGSTVSPGVGGGKKKKVMKGHNTHTEISKGPGALSKQETAKMLSKALKVSDHYKECRYNLTGLFINILFTAFISP